MTREEINQEILDMESSCNVGQEELLTLLLEWIWYDLGGKLYDIRELLKENKKDTD